MASVRAASHAGSWYSKQAGRLSAELDQWLEDVKDDTGDRAYPTPGARLIIAPHAGYAYSGPTAAWAYKSLDFSKAKRIFLLGPSHVIHLNGCALTSRTEYATPLGNLQVDQAIVEELQKTNKFSPWNKSREEEEHSLEMHLPYIYKMLSLSFKSPAEFPTIVPVLVGTTNDSSTREYGKLFAPYVADESSITIVSSDFCHWGPRFDYTYYLPDSESNKKNGKSLSRRDQKPTTPHIHGSIKRIDEMSMSAIETGRYQDFSDDISATHNTVCGRHPIGVIMSALELLEGDKAEGKGRFKFIKYGRSNDVDDASESSVSYASAVAVL